MDRDVRWINDADPGDENTFPATMGRILLKAQCMYRSAQRAFGNPYPEDLSPELTKELIRLGEAGATEAEIVEVARKHGEPQGV